MVVFASDNGAHLEGGLFPAHEAHSHHPPVGCQAILTSSSTRLAASWVTRGDPPNPSPAPQSIPHGRSLYEGGVRSPTMVRWPGTIPVRTSDYAWAFWDVMPTLAELSGGTAAAGIDGVSIVPTLMGQDQPAKDYLYWTWKGTGVPPLRPPLLSDNIIHPHSKPKHAGFAIRAGEWKAVVPHCKGGSPSPHDEAAMQVYHLPSDPFEQHDLAGTKQGHAKAKQLLQKAMGANATCHCYQC